MITETCDVCATLSSICFALRIRIVRKCNYHALVYFSRLTHLLVVLFNSEILQNELEGIAAIGE